MKLLTLITMSILVVSCGSDHTETIHHIPGKSIENKVEIPVETIVEVPEVRQWEGIYYLDNGSCLDLIETREGEVFVGYRCSDLVSINPENGTYGQFPKVKVGPLKPENRILRFSKNLNYNKDKGDIEKDSGGDIDGRKRTDFTIEFVDDMLKVTVLVYDNADMGNLNYIVAERVFSE